jgi:hypothetical protein
VILVSRFVRFDKYDTAPLLFHQGKFKEVRQHAEPLPDSSRTDGGLSTSSTGSDGSRTHAARLSDRTALP